MLKQTSTYHTGQLLALHTSDWSVECIGPLWSASTLQKLQQVARVCGVSKFQQQQSEDLLHELDWLPIRKQIHYKIATRHCIYTVSQKKRPTFKLSLTLSNLNQFSKFLHCWKAYEICCKSHMTIPTLP